MCFKEQQYHLLVTVHLRGVASPPYPHGSPGELLAILEQNSTSKRLQDTRPGHRNTWYIDGLHGLPLLYLLKMVISHGKLVITRCYPHLSFPDDALTDASAGSFRWCSGPSRTRASHRRDGSKLPGEIARNAKCRNKIHRVASKKNQVNNIYNIYNNNRHYNINNIYV